jgi:hypothetical protein
MLRKLLNGLRGNERQLLIHAHMFKNAGTTFDWSLRRCFGAGFTDHRDDEAMKQGAHYLQSWLLSHEHCQALSSHWITPPLPEIQGLNVSLCLLFRDPIERMRSVYQFERSQTGVDTPGAIRAKKMSFAEYIEWQFQPMPGPVVKNYQTRYCSGNYLGDDLEDSFGKAEALLQSQPVVGLVHRYDESMVLMEYFLQPQFSNLDLSYVRQNVLSGMDTPMDDRRAAVLDELGELAPKALDFNRYDIELFSLAEQKFETLLQQVPDLDARLADLHRRSGQLARDSDGDAQQ